MKLCRGITKKMKIFIVLLYVFFSCIVRLENVQQDQKYPEIDPTNNKDPVTYKLLFMHKYKNIKSKVDHSLNNFSYKNILFTEDQIAVFSSPNEGDSSNDEKYDTSNYLITFRYEFLDLPCLNRSFVCTHSQFLKEYKPFYKEIDYTIPKEIQEKFGDVATASTLCLLILTEPITTVENGVWVCHPDLKTLLNIQQKISSAIYNASNEEYQMIVSYFKESSGLIQGIMNLSKENFIFMDMNKNAILTVDWKDVDSYGVALYLKDEYEWNSDSKKPNPQRCFKIDRSLGKATEEKDFFCVFTHRNDLTLKIQLSEAEAKFAADMYVNQVNLRIQTVHVKQSLTLISKMSQTSLEIDANILFSLKIEVRVKYFIERHILINKVKLNEMKRTEFTAKLVEVKDKVINSVCAGTELCKNALHFCVDKGLLPLKGIREKFAMDCQNPYNRHMPKVNIKIEAFKAGSLGKAILSAVAKLKGTKDYFAEKIAESPPGQVPNFTSIKMAWNTVLILRERKEYRLFMDIKQNCVSSKRSNSSNIRRKISFLMYAGINDVYFEYLGFIRDFQLTKK